MKRTYTIGSDQNEISFSVEVFSPGSVSTIVQQRWAAGQLRELGKSNPIDLTGSVAGVIGTGQSLRDSHLVVFISILAPNISDNDVLNVLRNTRVKFTFEGGASGTQAFPLDNDDIYVHEANKSASIIKPFKMA